MFQEAVKVGQLFELWQRQFPRTSGQKKYIYQQEVNVPEVRKENHCNTSSTAGWWFVLKISENLGIFIPLKSLKSYFQTEFFVKLVKQYLE